MRGSIHQTSAVDGRCFRHSPLETGQPAAALHEFEAALEQTPNRYRTFLVIARAATDVILNIGVARVAQRREFERRDRSPRRPVPFCLLRNPGRAAPSRPAGF
jgi:hypothetical protein